MNKGFFIIGCVTLLLVATAILTKPTEADYEAFLEREQGIVCSGQDFMCQQESDNEDLELIETKIQDRVFFTVFEKTFQKNDGTRLVAAGFGIFSSFFFTSVENIK